MTASKTFLAVDLGASNGRLMAGRWNGSAFSLQEVHRFANGGVRVGSGLHWNALGIWAGILEGLRKCRAQSAETPSAIGIDAWGVDFGLLDREGRLLGNPYHYRDARTEGMLERASRQMDGFAFFQQTGVHPMSINTLYQLMSMARTQDSQLQQASRLLMIPDLFQYFLCHEMCAEYTEATTTQLCDPGSRTWSAQILDTFDIRTDLFGPIYLPGSVLGAVQPWVRQECGFSGSFPTIAVASHDTASAVAAIPGMDEQSAFISCGTWSLIGTRIQTPLRSQRVYDLGFTNEGAADGGMLCIRNLTGLWILQECMRLWSMQGKGYHWEQLMQAAASAEPHRSLIDTDAVEFQAPGDMTAAIGMWCAETQQPVPSTDAETVRCVLESLALKYHATLRDLEQATERALTVVRLVGGGARNWLLCQMTADACGRPVVAGPVEAAALGNVLVQAVAMGHLSSLDEGAAAMSPSLDLSTYQPQVADRWHEASVRLASIQRKRAAQQRECATQ